MVFKQILRQRAKKNNSTTVVDRVGPYGVLLKPIFTEKTYNLSNELSKYVFKVHADANKNDVKVAFETVYGIAPKSVSIVNVTKKGRAMRKLVRRAHKKAIITLNKGEKIELVK